MKPKKKLPLTSVLLMIGFIPLIVSSVIICVMTARIVTSHLEDDVYDKLHVAADGLRQYYQYELEAGNEVPYEHDYVDMLKGQDIEMTLFKGDTRLMTSALNDKGERNEGTQMASDIWAKVQTGQDVAADKVHIGAKDYYVYYMPIYDADGTVWGASWAGQPEDDVKANIRSVITLLLAIVIISILIFAVIICMVARRVLASIKGVTTSVETLASGDLTDDHKATSAIKELDNIGSNVYEMSNKLKEIVGGTIDASAQAGKQAKELAETSQQISDTSDGVSEAVQEMAKGATDQAETVQRATENIGTLSDAIQTVADNAEQLAGAAAEMNDASMQSAEALKKLSSNMDSMGEAVKEIASTMKDTNDAVGSVNEKVDGITSIASQTNLLALNASIEAARAGEAGRGFAVVAEEIGKLATESAQTAQEIRDEMNQLLIHAKAATEKTEEVSVIGKDVIAVLKETSGTISDLIANVSSTVDGVNTISGLTEECNASKEQIVDAMSSLSAISEENAASTEETGASMQELNATVNGLAAAAGSLNDVAMRLDEELRFFRV